MTVAVCGLTLLAVLPRQLEEPTGRVLDRHREDLCNYRSLLKIPITHVAIARESMTRGEAFECEPPLIAAGFVCHAADETRTPLAATRRGPRPRRDVFRDQ